MFVWCLDACIASCSYTALISSATAHIHCCAKKMILSSEKAEKYALKMKLSRTGRVNTVALFLS